jgi:hypothetical protein
MESPVDQLPTEAETLKASNMVDSRKDAEAYTTLVETVFRPLPIDANDNSAEEASLLPTLLNRVSSAIWSQGPTKQLVNEIQTLRAQKVAASRLLDDIEQEADAIEQRLQEKTKLAKIENNKPGMFAFPCVACSNCATNADEVMLQTKRAAPDVLELRPVLRHRLQECEQALTDRDSELRQLRHELNLLRCEQAVSTEEKDALLQPASTRKDSILLQYASRFALERNEQSQMQSTFFVWSRYTHQRILRNKMLKRTALALTSTSAHGMTVVFSSWRCLVQDRKQHEKLVRESRCRSVTQSYAAKFLTQANDSTILRAIILEWWRRSKEAALQAQ